MADEYILKQNAIDAFNRIKNTLKNPETAHYDTLMFYEIEDVLEDVEPADVAPVVHARWIKPTGMMPPEHHGHYECSECGTWAGRDWLRPWKEVLLTDFCPGCAAKMDGEE